MIGSILGLQAARPLNSVPADWVPSFGYGLKLEKKEKKKKNHRLNKLGLTGANSD